MRSSIVFSGLIAIVLTGTLPQDADAIPAFARKYRVSCSLCHSTIPRLTPFGEQFAANGFEMAVRELARDTIDTGDPMLRLLQRIDIAVRMDLFATASTPMRSKTRSSASLVAPMAGHRAPGPTCRPSLTRGFRCVSPGTSKFRRSQASR